MRSNLGPRKIGDEWWSDTTDVNPDAELHVEEALMYAEQRGILRRLPSAPMLVRVVLIEPKYQREKPA